MSGAHSGMSLLEAAKELYPDWQEPRRAGVRCKAPYREDKHPSFSIIPGTGGRKCRDHSEGKTMDLVEFVARAFNISESDACRKLKEMYQARCGAAGEPPTPLPIVVEPERNRARGRPKLPFLAEGS
jgi:hypothetical protein